MIPEGQESRSPQSSHGQDIANSLAKKRTNPFIGKPLLLAWISATLYVHH
jgi:hypothetical protein|tara:strand:+ start:207 stop:356 length:150 start_codon:yes stop_codon:yes gene_type:complete